MDSSELRRILRSDDSLAANSFGVFPYDKLPKNQSGFAICNLDNSTQAGSHWVAVFNQRQTVIDVFDSYGGIPKELADYTANLPVNYSSKVVQGALSTTCGQHCLYFGYHRTRGVPFSSIVASYADDGEANDQMVCEFVQDTFGVSTDPIDEDMIMLQISKSFLPA